jgi:hypothetical protein
MDTIFKKRVSPFFNDTTVEYIEFRNLTIDDFIIDEPICSFIEKFGTDWTRAKHKFQYKSDYPETIDMNRKWVLKFEVAKELNTIKIDSYYNSRMRSDEKESYITYGLSSRGYADKYKPVAYDTEKIVEALNNDDPATYYELGGLRFVEGYAHVKITYKGCRTDESKFNKIIRCYENELLPKFHEKKAVRNTEYLETGKYYVLDHLGSKNYNSARGVNIWLQSFAESFSDKWKEGIKKFCMGASLKSWKDDEYLTSRNASIEDIDAQIKALKEKRSQLRTETKEYEKKTLLDTFEESEWNIFGVEVPEELVEDIKVTIEKDGLSHHEDNWAIDLSELLDKE